MLSDAPLQFYGIGVGPGEQGLISVAAVRALRSSDVIFTPRAVNGTASVAYSCIADLELDESKFREITFNMDSDRSQSLKLYEELAAEIAELIHSGKVVAYLTIGDAMTFSTYSYLLESLLAQIPKLRHRTFAGVTSFAALAASVGWPIGQKKERILILPCPDSKEELQTALGLADMTVVMKIGHRLDIFAEAIQESGLECAIGQKIGQSNELISTDLEAFRKSGGAGYLTTALVRKKGGT